DAGVGDQGVRRRSNDLIGGLADARVRSQRQRADSRATEDPTTPASQQLRLLVGAPIGGDADGHALERARSHRSDGTGAVFPGAMHRVTSALRLLHMAPHRLFAILRAPLTR